MLFKKTIPTFRAMIIYIPLSSQIINYIYIYIYIYYISMYMGHN